MISTISILSMLLVGCGNSEKKAETPAKTEQQIKDEAKVEAKKEIEAQAKKEEEDAKKAEEETITVDGYSCPPQFINDFTPQEFQASTPSLKDS